MYIHLVYTEQSHDQGNSRQDVQVGQFGGAQAAEGAWYQRRRRDEGPRRAGPLCGGARRRAETKARRRQVLGQGKEPQTSFEPRVRRTTKRACNPSRATA